MGIFVTKFSKELRSSARTTKKRVYKQFDKEKFAAAIKEAKYDGRFKNIQTTDDVNEAIEDFTNVFNEILDKFAPLKVIQNRNNYIPYISKEIKELMQERNRLKEEATKTGSSQKYDEYKSMRNKVTAKLRTAKDEYFKEKFNEPDSTPKEIWKTTYQVLGNNRSNFPSQVLINGKLESKPINMAEEMNNFFLAKISKIKSNSVVIDELTP